MDEEPAKSWVSPTVQDVLDVKRFFIERFELPLELIDTVIDRAKYWPHSTSILVPAPGQQRPIHVSAGDEGENRFMVRTPPIGFVPTDTWQTTSHANMPPSTDVGPEHDGSDRYSWSLNAPLKPHIDSEISKEDNIVTEEVFSKWEEISIPRGEFPCRKIVFTIRSSDQGWGGSAADRGTYNGSFTWFDVGKERVIASRDDLETHEEQSNTFSSGFTFPIACSVRTIIPEVDTAPQDDSADAPSSPFKFHLLPGDHVLQKNQTATRAEKEHIITWSATDNIDGESAEGTLLERTEGRGKASMDGEYVRNLKVGDVITVWAKSRFGGWSNHVYDIKVEVYWAV
ncbi:hypothetical protein B0J14DRAFT_561764 [Halenospora varia]|nr:hypothetical protein B0J14DRAFT_561764 [Halenospora varia]